MKGIIGLIVIGVILLGLALTGTLVVKGEQLRDDYINSNRSKVVELTNLEMTSGGTGFYVKAPSGKSYILTNAHICGLANNSRILVNKWYTAPVLAVYKTHDLCLIGNPLMVTGLNVAQSVRNAENIYIIGHPYLDPLSTTKGQISGEMDIQLLIQDDKCDGPNDKLIVIDDPLLRIFLGPQVCIRTLRSIPVTANILPGNSGSPVLNVWGSVVGVAFAGREGSGRGYTVPLNEVQKFLRDY